MHIRRWWPVPVIAAVLVLVVAAFSHLPAQEVAVLTAEQGAGGGGFDTGLAQAGTTEQAEEAEEEFVSTGMQEVQAPPAAPAPVLAPGQAATVAMPSSWLAERTWEDGVRTVAECVTTEGGRSCKVNVYGPNGEFILGREIPASGEAVDCPGPCLDATGAVLDSSSLSRTQAATTVEAEAETVPEAEAVPEDLAVEAIRDRGE